MIRTDPIKDIMGVKCKKCSSPLVKTKEKAAKIWEKHVTDRKTPKRALADALREAGTLDCISCLTRPALSVKPKEETKFKFRSKPITEEVNEDAGSETE